VGPRVGLDTTVVKIQWEGLKKISDRTTRWLVGRTFNDAVIIRLNAVSDELRGSFLLTMLNLKMEAACNYTASEPENGSSKFLRNFGILPHRYTVSQPRRPRLESSPS
jgi:hypothetical protein